MTFPIFRHTSFSSQSAAARPRPTAPSRREDSRIGEVFRNATGAGSAAEASKRRGRPSGYTPEACNQVVTLMERGLSLTAAAAIMGITRSTAHNWMRAYPEFFDSVMRGQAARALKLETMLLETTSAAVVRYCCLALVNAAPKEWRKKRSAV